MCLYISCHGFLCLSFHSILNLFERIPFLRLKKKHDILIQVEFWVTFLCFPCHGTCQLSLSGFQPVYLLLPDSGFDTELLKQVKELEMQGVSAAEAGDLQAALQLFSQAIQILPQRASAYNNRAQALRLQGNTAGALEDLDQAISLSGDTGRTACQALVQRGLLRRLACQDDGARADFEKAAALGSEFARQQAVVLNPYAALCNKMLSEVINKLRNPEVSGMQ
uniref:Tetratricopeptide repeat protein 36 n=1 Tax=Lates calcarifer TaxID=8187 RepID=A0A4W6CHJ1_LATCA